MRYFLELAYNGAAYVGWQRQPNGMSVQEMLEQAFSTILGAELEIMGCGRTDTGVHARQYFAHFDYGGEFPKAFVRRVNKFLPPDIAVCRLITVAAGAHARFDAYYRAYAYHLDLRKNPFGQQTSHHFPFSEKLDFALMQETAELLLRYELFAPFCKTGHDAKTLRCELKHAYWAKDEVAQQWVFHIAANRFLRGMVRLMVGACLNVGLGKVSLAEVREALEAQTPLAKSTSAAPQGLYLTDIRYPYDLETLMDTHSG